MGKELSLNILEIAKKVKKLEDRGVGTAEDTTYDKTDSGLTADTVQGAIDELAGDIDGLSADDIDYDSTDSGLTATDVQGAVDEVATDVTSVKSRISANDLYNRVSISDYTIDNKYTCPTDGYIFIVNISDKDAYLVIDNLISIGSNKGRFATFVRKGTQVWNYGTPDYVYFVSIQ